MICNGCQRFITLENHELGLCADCNRARRDTDDDLYFDARRMFLEMCIRIGLTCPVKGSPIDYTSDIHHKKGRGDGFADEWARDNGITLTIDVRFFLAVSREGHQWIETHPTEAKAKGWSLTRLDTISK